ncbi:MAG: hypothetical protein K9W44_10365 [Candidatus Lokiarchaeota archaeon]|nr:hypothetical protein [Candidatus Harpocratesius repetitus]
MKENYPQIMKLIAVLNLFFICLIIALEVLSLWIKIPFLSGETLDPIGLSEITGSWPDFLIRLFIMVLSLIIYISALTNLKLNPSKAYSFIIGGGFLLLGIGGLSILIYGCQILDLLIQMNFEGWNWYSGFHLEMMLFFINLPVLRIWKKKYIIFEKV